VPGAPRPLVRVLAPDEAARLLTEAPGRALDASALDEGRRSALIRLGLLAEDRGPAAIAGPRPVPSGFYLPSLRSMVIVDRGRALDDELVMTTFVHESVHVLQDAGGRVAAAEAGRSDDYDGLLALRAAVEGEASLYGSLFRDALTGTSPSSAPLGERFLADVEICDRAVASLRSAYLLSPNRFVYAYGARWAALAWLRDGPSGLRAAVDAPPDSTAAILRAAAGLPGSRALAGHGRRGRADRLGAWLLFAWLVRGAAPDASARHLAAEIADDRLVMRATRDQHGADRPAFEWRITFTAPAAAAAAVALDPRLRLDAADPSRVIADGVCEPSGPDPGAPRTREARPR
jgi:hypothetical protein